MASATWLTIAFEFTAHDHATVTNHTILRIFVLGCLLFSPIIQCWLGSRVVSVLDSGAEGPGFKSQSRHCRATVLGKLFTPIVPLFTKQQNW